VRGSVSAVSEVDLYNQLQSAGLELVQCSRIDKKKNALSGFQLNKIKTRDLIQFFIHMEQMQSAGVPLLDALSDIRDGAENDQMRDMMSDIFRDVRDGTSLSEALSHHPKVFKPLYISMVESGEETGDLTATYKQLEKYLKWVDELQGKVKKATRYPMVVTAVVLFTIVFMMSYVVPQIVGFLKFLDMELPFYSKALIATSNFFIEVQFTFLSIPVYGALIVLFVPLILAVSFILAKNLSADIAYKIDALYLILPVAGNIIRKITIARYAQTFAALFASGIDVISALRAARKTVNNLILIEAMDSVERYVQAGSPLSDSLNASGEFPSMVVRMVKIGEESGNLAKVLEQVSEFYTRDVDDAIESLIEMIQPTLTIILALVIVWIAAGSLGPIYMNLGNMMPD
jgi:type IV pilus assembly protein PilC